MFSRIFRAIKGTLAALLLIVNTVIGFSLMIPFALLKAALPFRGVRQVADAALNAIAEGWSSVNGWWIAAVGRTRWHVTGVDGFKRKGWYLVSSNHQSWVDILVLQRTFNRRIPLLKFFIKYELIFVPVIGLAWWALDFPFMKRKGGVSAQKDLETARKACEKFRVIPTSVISFLEGTRFTRSKQAQQKSPYQHLLKPKAGGIGMALETMGDMFDAMIDVTIVYPNGVPEFWQLLSGQMDEVVVKVREVAIPRELLHRDATGGIKRAELQAWINGLWEAKDREIAGIEAQFKASKQP